MKIPPIEPGRLTPEVPDSAAQRPASRSGTVLSRDRRDRVEISAEALERSRGESRDASHGPALAEPVPADAPDRMDVIAQRLRTGFYELPEVLASVADRIVASQDLNR